MIVIIGTVLILGMLALAAWISWPDGSGSILCSACSHINPSGNQRRPGPGERCEVCGQEGAAP